jgi:hypothetical protein
MSGHPGPPEPPLRALELLSALQANGVEFVVIGGFSLAAHGYVRGTKDVDIVPEPSRENLGRLLAALHELEAEPIAIGEFKSKEMPLPLDLDGLSQGGNWLLRTRFGRLDVMQHVHGMTSYAKLRAGAIRPEIPPLDDAPPFAGYDDLIAMKQAAGRDQDLIDIGELVRARETSS